MESKSFVESNIIVLDKLGLKININCLGIDIADFLEGKVRANDIRDREVEMKVWVAALFVLKNNLNYSKEMAVEKFSRLPGFRKDEITRKQVSYYWDRM